MGAAPWWKNTRGEWYVIVQFTLLGLLLIAPLLPLGQPAWPQPWGWLARLAGLLLGGLGALLIAAGLLALGRHLSPLPHPKEDADLVAEGIYGLVRHPIYGGLLLGAFGWALLTHSLLALLLAAALFGLLEFKARREEQALERQFPKYRAYRRRTRKFLPWLY